MEIKQVKISELKPAEYNPRLMTEKQVEDLTASIKKFGIVDPIIVNKDNTIIGGHQRVKIAQQLGMETVPVYYVDLDKEQEKELNLRLNKNLGEWDWNALANFDMEVLEDVGFDSKELEVKFNIEGEEDDFDVDLEDIKEPESKLGEVYELGRHRLMCGDSTKKEDVEKLMGGNKADMVFTDPPYNVDYKGMQNSKQWDSIVNDMMPPDKFESFLISVFKNIFDSTTDKAALYVCHSDKSQKEFRNAIEYVGYDWRATINWVKNSPAFNFAQYKYKHEPIYYCFKRDKIVSWYGDRTQHTIWEAKKIKGDHPTIKPVELIIKALKNSSKKDDIVLDLFGGSGSTLIACEQLDRTCYMMELDPKYCDVIRKRYEQYTERTEK